MFSKDEVLTIEYFLLDDQLLIWVLSPAGKLATISSPVGRQELEQTVGEFDKFVNTSELSTSDRAALSTLLNKLYNQLIKPVEAYLPASEDETITIIPHEQLFHIPFGALVTNLAENIGQQPKYLIEKHPLVYSPSIALLRYTQQNKKRVIYSDKPNLLALVNPKPVSGYEQSISGIDLKITEQHFDEIVQFYPDKPSNKVFRGEEATQEVLQREAPRFNVLYLASHAKVFEDNPLESYIALSRTPFTVRDVFKLDLHTDLVILGACETGRGKITGDGVNGFSRAFTWAGSPSLLISLWTVPEKQTLNQMYKFHEYWRKQGMTKAQALRMAQVNSLQHYPDQPNIWAGFILFGEYQ